jgi:hypothetical protein
LRYGRSNPKYPECLWSFLVPESEPARRRKLFFPWLFMAPVLALAGCGSKASDELEARLARAEAAAQRAEKAQHAAESAAARAKSDRNAAASEEGDVTPNDEESAQRSEPEADPNQSSSENQADDAG